MQAKSTTADPNGFDAPIAWRAWPGVRGPSSVEGAISGVPLGEVDAARVVVQGNGARVVVPVRGGRFAVDGLAPGMYRVEIRFARLVLARRIELPIGHHFVRFAVRRAQRSYGRAA